MTAWPDAETAVGGPFHNYSSALEEARRLVKDRYAYIWYDYARLGESERLDQVGGGDLA